MSTHNLFLEIRRCLVLAAPAGNGEQPGPGQPDEPTPETEKVNASIVKEDQWLGVGLVFHLI